TEVRTIQRAEVVFGIRKALERNGSVSFRVKGGSMLPFIWPNTMVTVIRTRTSDLAVGDVILFQCGDQLALHRVIRKEPAGYVVSGDASPQSGSLVFETQILGRLRDLTIGRLALPGLPRLLQRGIRRLLVQCLPTVHGLVPKGSPPMRRS